MRCPNCGNCELTHVGFQAVDGAEYRYCGRCENSWWESNGTKIETIEVLKAASAIVPSRRRAA
jgi:hypothetical protein